MGGMLLWVFAAVSLILSPANLPGYEAGNFWFEENEIESDMVEKLSACVVFLSDESNDKYITGTLLSYGNGIILTNYHLLSSSADAVSAYLNTSENKVEKFRCRLLKADAGPDLAAFEVTLYGKTLSGLASEGFLDNGGTEIEMPYTNRYLTGAYFAASSEIRRGRKIAFFGFPLNYGITFEKESKKFVKKPIFRSGRIASEIFNDEYLIDAMVSSGNSGSPVFVRSFFKNGRQVLPGYKFAGIIKEFQHDTIKIVLDGKKAVDIPHNTGLGIVIPVEVIKHFIGGISSK